VAGKLGASRVVFLLRVVGDMVFLVERGHIRCCTSVKGAIWSLGGYLLFFERVSDFIDHPKSSLSLLKFYHSLEFGNDELS
jgi:hypothetical protein